MAERDSFGDSLGGQLSPVETGDRITRQVARESVRHRLFGTPRLETKLGRFHLLRRLGEGGMGVVYAAEDPQLRRMVALKVLHKGKFRGPDDENRRLLREAQALARLRHPNVVRVYDVGTHDDQVYIAMELVEGKTLRAIVEEPTTSWREALEPMLEAGAGLAAAHRAGLIHRDFKPENILVDTDGRAHVADFGLASAQDVDVAGVTLVSGEPDGETRGVTPRNRSTGAARLVGTPRYMAPEQFEAGAGPDPRSDQFSFCVTLFEALYGRFPFPVSSDPTALAAKRRHQLAVPSDRAVPRWLHRIVERGLCALPDDRYENMDELLEAITRARARNRRGWSLFLGLMAIAGVASLGAVWGSQHGTTEPEAPCTGLDEPYNARWNEAIADELATDYAALDAGPAWARARGLLDDWFAQWNAARVDACEATKLRGTQSDELLDLRMRCLDARLSEAKALVDVLAKPTSEHVDSTISVAAELPGLEECEDVEGLRAVAPFPEDPETATALAEVHNELGLVRALSSLGAFEDASSLSTKLVARATPLGHEPTLARALQWRGSIRRSLGDSEKAVEDLKRAALAAERGRDDRLKAHLWTDLAFIAAHDLEDFDRAGDWADYAEATIARIEPALAAQADLANARGAIFERQGKNDEALAHFERAYELSRAVKGNDHPSHDDLTSNLGAMYLQTGDIDRALTLMEESLELALLSYGELHPTVAITMSNIATAHFHAGQFERSAKGYRRALEIMERTQGPRSRNVAQASSNYGSALADLGRYDEAMEHQQLALEIFEETLPEDHSQRMITWGELGRLELRRGHPAQSLEAWRKALAVANLRADSRSRGYMLRGVATAETKLGKLTAAKIHIEQSIEIGLENSAKFVGNEMVLARCQQAEIELKLGNARAALTAAEAGAEVTRSGKQIRAEILGRLAFVHARAHFAIGNREQAMPRAAEALRQLESDTRPSIEAQRQRIREWIAAQR